MTEERVYIEGFRLVVSDDGLLIEAIDYHTRPLFLDAKRLAELGLALAGSRQPSKTRTRRSKRASPP